MKVVVLSESSADEAAIRILVDGILSRKTQSLSPPPLRSRGWPSVIRILPTVLKYLHYRTDADALVVIVDSDDSPVHNSSHDETGNEAARCRYCQLRQVVELENANLKPVLGRSAVKIAIGLAVPSIEAWYRCVFDSHVNEATWIRKLQGESITYTRKTLKADVYGTERPSIEIETIHALEAANKLMDDLALIEQLFPVGFGLFARDVRNW
jgi:hypothetical protein